MMGKRERSGPSTDAGDSPEGESSVEIRQLVYFINACKFKNFTKAADACGVVQTAITHQISALEKDLGVELFIRGKRGVELTPAGEVFYKEAKALVEQSERARRMVADVSTGRDQLLNIGYSGQLLRGDLPVLLDRFRREHPGVSVRLDQGTTDNLIDRLESRTLDCLFVLHYDYYALLDWMESRTIVDDTLSLVLRDDHPFASKACVTLADLRALNVILYWEKGTQEYLLRHARLGLPMNVGMVTDSSDNVGILVEGGFGVAISMTSQTAHLRGSRLKFIPFEDETVRSRIVLLRHRDRVEPPLSAFMELVDRYDFHRHRFRNQPNDQQPSCMHD